MTKYLSFCDLRSIFDILNSKENYFFSFHFLLPIVSIGKSKGTIQRNENAFSPIFLIPPNAYMLKQIERASSTYIGSMSLQYLVSGCLEGSKEIMRKTAKQKRMSSIKP